MNTDDQADELVAQKSTIKESSDNCNDKNAPLPTIIRLISGSLIDNCPHSSLYSGKVALEDKSSQNEVQEEEMNDERKNE